MDETHRKPRSDALKNRARLIEAAKEVLGRGGPEASLEAVAREAGVGIGTLYRHFPTREALFQAVYRHDVEDLLRLAEALDRPGGGVAALREWMHANVALVGTKRGLLGALAVVVGDDSKAMYSELSARILRAVDGLLQRAIAEGEVRADVSAEDLTQTFYALCYARPPEPGWEVQVRRLLDIFIDGLRRRH
ncbi:MAG: TetR/AcrR family transcriptional regulator [Paracoccaceae bacterium]|nr:TetR/AcrR family transcriptional regulator [Paracoccaceae bacterium]MDE3123247.1 TetR/AcrR family transcriptional regulator [Paracoccaceae bacterium]